MNKLLIFSSHSSTSTSPSSVFSGVLHVKAHKYKVYAHNNIMIAIMCVESGHTAEAATT